jgi:hypothetical protein
VYKPTFDEVYEKEFGVEQLQAQLTQAREEFHAAACAYVGVSKGDVVRLLADGTVLKVTDVKVFSWQRGDVWLRGRPQKKDGTWSKLERNSYGKQWEKVRSE